ncbi:MAG: tRNA uracil 4-sulfurtransferase ThiI, partial [Vicinamibacterales bacterium]
QEKARELAILLTRYQYDSRLLLVPFADVQQQVILTVPPPLRVVLYRRLMMRIAEAVARLHRARALVTGEVVGQVASQTLENLNRINEVVELPVLRPLIGMDKEEITAEAQRLGTYPISIIPDQDCCTLFTPKHPSTKARQREVELAEASLPMRELIDKAAGAAVVEEFKFPVVK